MGKHGTRIRTVGVSLIGPFFRFTDFTQHCLAKSLKRHDDLLAADKAIFSLQTMVKQPTTEAASTLRSPAKTRRLFADALALKGVDTMAVMHHPLLNKKPPSEQQYFVDINGHRVGYDSTNLSFDF